MFVKMILLQTGKSQVQKMVIVNVIVIVEKGLSFKKDYR